MIYMLSALISAERKIINMLGLLLTLFSSLLSYCPTIYSVDHNESKVEIQEEIPIKNIADKNGTWYIYSNYDFLHSYFIPNIYLYQQSYFSNAVVGSHLYYYNLDCALCWYSQLDLEDPSRSQVVDRLSYLDIECITRGGSYASGNGDYNDYMFYFRNQSGTSMFSFRFRDFSLYEENNGSVVYHLSGDLFSTDNYNNSYAILEYSGWSLVLHGLMTDPRSNTEAINAYNNGYSVGYDAGVNSGYTQGYNQALDDTAETSGTALTIFTGILDVGLLPVNVFLAILNFEVFGINIAGMVSGFLSIALFVIVIRFIFGGKKND